VWGLEVRFGNAALVRRPLLAASAAVLDDDADEGRMPPPRGGGWLARVVGEPRGVVRVTIDGGGAPVDVLVTHLDAFEPTRREAQAAVLLRRFVAPDRTTVLLGDVNAVPTELTLARRFAAGDRTHDVLTSGPLADARISYALAHDVATVATWATFPAARPTWPLDAAFASLDLEPVAVAVIGTDASDHRGLFVHLVGRSAGAEAVARARHLAIRRRQRDRIARCDVGADVRSPRSWLLRTTGFATVADEDPSAEAPSGASVPDRRATAAGADDGRARPPVAVAVAHP
jgi:endonuclease/exonuclease/phosphatase family metal-dependent hydrolase